MEPTPTLDLPPPREADDVERCSAGRLVVLLLAGAAVLLSALVGRQDLALVAVPSVPPPLGTVRVDADHVSLARDGVFVIPVVLSDSGRGLTRVSARAYASPVRLDPVALPPRAVEPGGSRTVVVVLAPDCRTLRSWGLRFRASLLVGVVSGGDRQDLPLSLDDVPVVSAGVRSLCGTPRAALALSDQR